MTFRTTAFCVFLALSLGGCVGALPGGTDSVNESHYQNEEQLRQWVDTLEPGMSKQEVFARLGRIEDDFRKLPREDVVSSLFGGRDSGVPAGFDPGVELTAFLDSLTGYRLDYKAVKRRHGFSSPIRLQTDEKGFHYTVILLFRDNLLMEKPEMTGGNIIAKDTNTLFDYLNPGTILNRALD